MKKIATYLKIENVIILISLSIMPLFTSINIAYSSSIFKNTLRVPIGKTTIERLSFLKPEHITPEDIASIIQEEMRKTNISIPIWFIGSSTAYGFSSDDMCPFPAYKRDIDLVFPYVDSIIRKFVEKLIKDIENSLPIKLSNTKNNYVFTCGPLKEFQRSLEIRSRENAKPFMIETLTMDRFFLPFIDTYFGFDDINNPKLSKVKPANYLVPFGPKTHKNIYRITPFGIDSYSDQDTKLVYLQLFLDLTKYAPNNITDSVLKDENSLYNISNIKEELKSVTIVNGYI